MQETVSIPGSGRPPGERNGNPTPVSLPGESHGLRSLGTVHGVAKSGTMGYTQHNPHLCLTEFYFLIKKRKKEDLKNYKLDFLVLCVLIST